MPKVLITGVSGYVGSWCMQKALEADYEVIGTVRDPTSKKCAFLREALEGKSTKISSKASRNLKLVKADLLDGEEAWSKLFDVEGNIEYVLHTASPYFAQAPADPNDYIRPACEGTESVLKAAVSHNVKQVVVTSSVAAVWDPMVNSKKYTAQDWSDPSAQTAYGQSKTLAEQKAWSIVKGTKTGLATVLPMMVIGPTLYNDKEPISGFESGELCVKFMTRKMPAVPRMKFGISDVRDVAEVHIRALQVPEAVGRRFITSTQTYWMREIAAMFGAQKPELKIPSREMPSCLVGCLALCSPNLKRMKNRVDVDYTIDNSPVSQVLGLKLTSEKKTILEMMDDMIQLGAVPSKKE